MVVAMILYVLKVRSCWYDLEPSRDSRDRTTSSCPQIILVALAATNCMHFPHLIRDDEDSYRPTCYQTKRTMARHSRQEHIWCSAAVILSLLFLQSSSRNLHSATALQALALRPTSTHRIQLRTPSTSTTTSSTQLHAFIPRKTTTQQQERKKK